MNYQNLIDLLIGLNFEDAAHNPELVADPQEQALVDNNLLGERIDSILSAPNVGEQFNRTYLPHGGGLGLIIPLEGELLTITIEGDKQDRIRITIGAVNMAYQLQH